MKLEKAFTISVTDVNEKPTAIQVTIGAQSKKKKTTDRLRKDNNISRMMINKTNPAKKVTD